MPVVLYLNPLKILKKVILKYKMANKFMKRTFQNDDSSSTTSTLKHNDSEENDLNQRKYFFYFNT
jgi:hypothetical protein